LEGVWRENKVCLIVIILLVTPTFIAISPVKAVTNSDVIEIEIAQFQVEQDFDTLLNPGAADVNFTINVLGVDDDLDSTTLPDNDWFIAPTPNHWLFSLFHGDTDIDISEDELFRSYPGPAYVPKVKITLPVEFQIKVWDNDLLQLPELIISVSATIDALPFERTFENAGFYMRVVARSIPQIPMHSIPPNEEGLWYYYEIGADAVRSQYAETDFSKVRIALIDSGINPAIDNLGSKIVFWRDLANRQMNPYDDPDEPHGTEVAAIIAGETAGIAKNSDLIVIKPYMPQTIFEDVTRSVNSVAEAITLAVTQNAKVISLSLGFSERELTQDNINTLRTAVNNAYSAGAVIVAAAGNDRTCLEFYPSHLDNVISVSSLLRFDPDSPYFGVDDIETRDPNTNSYLIFADLFSNFGTDYTTPATSIELSAPGSQIHNFPQSPGLMLFPMVSDNTAGTSFSCPMVSAVAALAIGYAKEKYNIVLAPDQVKSILTGSSIDLGPPNWDPYYGYGMVNAYQSLQEIDRVYFQEPRAGGPDTFGYTYKDRNCPGGPTYNWLEISESGTAVLPTSDDQWVGNINLGFFFNYYGTDYSQLAIGNNGLLFSGTGTSQYVNQPITQTTSIHGLIAPFWDDIVTWNNNGETPTAKIIYKTMGTAPNRMFIVEWYDNQHYSSSTSGITFEVILYEGTNNILFQYKDTTFGTVSGSTGSDLPPYDNGGSATVGIEDPTGSIGLQYSYNEQLITPGLAILFKFPQFSGTNMYVSMQAPSTMDRGNSMTYTVYYNNFGDMPASAVGLSMVLSSNVNYVSASDGGIFDSTTRAVTWNLGSVPDFPSGRGVRTVSVSIPSSTLSGTIIPATASATTSTLEVRYDDNTATVLTTVTSSGLPPGVIVGPTVGTSGGEPSVWWTTPITFTYTTDLTATSVDIRIHLNDGGSDITGSMTGGPPTWTFTTTFYPRTGHATVTYTVHSTTTIIVNFNIYVDPAGYIYDAESLERIGGANVWLQRPDGLGGWENVSTGANPANMVPDINPLITNVDGQYQWDTLPGTYRVHVEAAGYYSADSIVVNVPPPVTDLHIGLTHLPVPTGSIIINAGDEYAISNNVTLTLTYLDDFSGVSQVRYRNDATWDTEIWETPSSTKTWTLTSGDGNKTVYYQIRSNIGTVSVTFSDNIILDTTPPSGSIIINNGYVYANVTSATLTLTSSDATSGASQVRYSNDGSTWSSWESASSSKAWTLTSGDGTKTVYYQIRDNAGLLSITYSDTIILQSPVPSPSPSPSTTQPTVSTASPSPTPSNSPSPVSTTTASPSAPLQPTPTSTPKPQIEQPLFLFLTVGAVAFAIIGASAYMIKKRPVPLQD
jgi:uncharacterized repeat protein (TIGR01451 family)